MWAALSTQITNAMCKARASHVAGKAGAVESLAQSFGPLAGDTRQALRVLVLLQWQSDGAAMRAVSCEMQMEAGSRQEHTVTPSTGGSLSLATAK